jgi:hypothetical protein
MSRRSWQKGVSVKCLIYRGVSSYAYVDRSALLMFTSQNESVFAERYQHKVLLARRTYHFFILLDQISAVMQTRLFTIPGVMLLVVHGFVWIVKCVSRIRGHTIFIHKLMHSIWSSLKILQLRRRSRNSLFNVWQQEVYHHFKTKTVIGFFSSLTWIFHAQFL